MLIEVRLKVSDPDGGCFYVGGERGQIITPWLANPIERYRAECGSQGLTDCNWDRTRHSHSPALELGSIRGSSSACVGAQNERIAALEKLVARTTRGVGFHATDVFGGSRTRPPKSVCSGSGESGECLWRAGPQPIRGRKGHGAKIVSLGS